MTCFFNEESEKGFRATVRLREATARRHNPVTSFHQRGDAGLPDA
jgi:hypothetical protein